MKFSETALKGALIIHPEPVEDERGFFARTFCRKEFAERGLQTELVQCSISFNRKKGTIRGMHRQLPPREETRLVRCTRGAIYDVIVDLRPDSPTFRKWVAAELTENNRLQFYVPPGFAHGFQTLADESEVFYQMNEFYAPEYSSGVRFDDPALKIDWPHLVTIISAQIGSWLICFDLWASNRPKPVMKPIGRDKS